MQKNPSKPKAGLEEFLFSTWQSCPPNTVFLIWRAVPYLGCYLQIMIEAVSLSLTEKWCLPVLQGRSSG